MHRALEKHHGHENDADRQRGHERRHGDLLRAVEDRPDDRFAHAEIAMNVFDLDRSVVDQYADSQRQSAERHDVDRITEEPKDDQRGENRQRDRRGDNHRAAPAAEKDQNHQRGQAGGDQCLSHHPVDGRFHEDRLIE